MPGKSGPPSPHHQYNTMAITLVNVTCHCSANKFKVAFDTSSLPVTSDLCHCNTCRHSTGLLFVHTVPIMGTPLSSNVSKSDMDKKPGDFQHLKAYFVAEHLSTYFCSRCSSYMFCRASSKGAGYSWKVHTGILEQTEGIVEVGSHRFVGDTGDGGFANHYPTVFGLQLPRYKSTKDNEEDVAPFNWKASKLLKAQEKPLGTDETLSAYCDCKSINLTLSRVTTITKPSLQWWLVPAKDEQSEVRYLAVHCVCNTCRLIGGALINSWVYLPRSNVIDTHTSLPVILDPKAGESRTAGLTQYESSPGVFRECCATCGAKVFYWSRSRKGGPDILDIAAGLLDQEQEGARADRWFAWASRVPFPDAAIDKRVRDDLEDGLKAFRCHEFDYGVFWRP